MGRRWERSRAGAAQHHRQNSAQIWGWEMGRVWMLKVQSEKDSDKPPQALLWEVLEKFREKIKTILNHSSWCSEHVGFL